MIGGVLMRASSVHFSWTAEIHQVLNRGLLPPDYYALFLTSDIYIPTPLETTYRLAGGISRVLT